MNATVHSRLFPWHSGGHHGSVRSGRPTGNLCTVSLMVAANDWSFCMCICVVSAGNLTVIDCVDVKAKCASRDACWLCSIIPCVLICHLLSAISFFRGGDCILIMNNTNK